ncbi:MAG: redoxin domain-containing protein [Planctomycetaceae bacterium]|nr:redoxin domain-containing protein [Planctomycetaceae bacterium]
MSIRKLSCFHAVRGTLGLGSIILAGMLLAAHVAVAAEPPTLEQSLIPVPKQNDVEFDTPDPTTHKQCKIDPITVKEGKEEKVRGWALLGPTGQFLRRFLDTDGDEIVDQFSYYRAGIEVYRESFATPKKKINEFRWLNLGGMRWGIDSNRDGKIDEWKSISAEEVSKIALRALVTQDVSLLTPLLINKNDLKSLGIKGPLAEKLLASVADPADNLKKSVIGSKVIHGKTVWMQFDASPPGAVPADRYKTPADLYVYENVMAIVDSGNAKESGLVSIGELVRVGDVWKMTTFPQPMEGNRELPLGPIMFHDQGGAIGDPAAPDTLAISEKIQKLVERLKKLSENSPPATASKAAFDKYYKELETVLIELVNESKSAEDKSQWTLQLLDTITAAVQSGQYPSGVGRLKELEGEIGKSSPKSPLLAEVRFRILLTEDALKRQEAKGNNEALQKVHSDWLKSLEEFLDENPKAGSAADAGLQLAVALEFSGKYDRAKKWYQRLVSDYGDAPSAARAGGALRRIDLVGKVPTLSGTALAGSGTIDVKQFRGKIVLVFFWDTKSKLCLEDLPQLKTLYDEYRAKGFEVIGVNLDVIKDEVGPYLSQQQVKWPQIYEPGGMESAPARDYGIIAVPTMFLVDADGKVTNRSASVADVSEALAEAYKSK